MNRESIFSSSMRTFFISMAAIIGIIFGFAVVLTFAGALKTTVEGTPELNYKYTPIVLANAEGKRKLEKSTSPVILKIKIDGVIGLERTVRQNIQRQLIESREQAFKDDRVKGLILEIDTPGGTVVDAEAIYRAIKSYKEKYKVPVYAYVDGLCASGGMYVACSADKIYASNSSLIGSVGVLVNPPFFNVSKLLNTIGVDALTLSAGKGKDEMDPVRPWKPGEQDTLQAIIDYYYGQFVDIVSANRPALTKDKLVDDYGAKIFPAALAKEYGYIDVTNASLDMTLTDLVKSLGIEDNYYQFVEFKDSDWLSAIFSSQGGLAKGEVKHTIQIPGQMNPALSNQFLYLYRPAQ